jgi:hypothetical protein
MFKIIWTVIQLVIALRGLHPNVDLNHDSLLEKCVVQDDLHFNWLMIPDVHVFVQSLFWLVARLLLDIFVVYRFCSQFQNALLICYVVLT